MRRQIQLKPSVNSDENIADPLEHAFIVSRADLDHLNLSDLLDAEDSLVESSGRRRFFKLMRLS